MAATAFLIGMADFGFVEYQVRFCLVFTSQRGRHDSAGVILLVDA
jgi:hypothetical protein